MKPVFQGVLRKYGIYSTIASLWDHKTDSSNSPAERANTRTTGQARTRNSSLKRSSSTSIASGAKRALLTKNQRSNSLFHKTRLTWRPFCFTVKTVVLYILLEKSKKDQKWGKFRFAQELNAAFIIVAQGSPRFGGVFSDNNGSVGRYPDSEVRFLGCSHITKIAYMAIFVFPCKKAIVNL